MTMTFLGCVNRILRINGLIRGDTDALVSFSDTSHNSSSQLAQIAIQSEISELTGRGLLPYQHKEQQTLTLLTATRQYTFPSDFIQLWGENPFFYDATQNNQIFEYPGGEDQLRSVNLTYRTDAGYPMYFYHTLGTTRTVAFFPVPTSSENNRSLIYDYSGSANVSIETDTIPLITTDQQYAFSEMASRRFKFLYEGKTDKAMDADQVYVSARASLFMLLQNRQAKRRYGKVYV